MARPCKRVALRCIARARQVSEVAESSASRGLGDLPPQAGAICREHRCASTTLYGCLAGAKPLETTRNQGPGTARGRRSSGHPPGQVGRTATPRQSAGNSSVDKSPADTGRRSNQYGRGFRGAVGTVAASPQVECIISLVHSTPRPPVRGPLGAGDVVGAAGGSPNDGYESQYCR